MRRLLLCCFTIMMVTSAHGEEEEQLMESVGFGEEEVHLKCFHCDLGFWDACYTTETNCSLGERCFTGRGKAADALDVKTLGCVKTEECDVETTVKLFTNNNVFAMTKHCCDTPFCNAAHKLPTCTLVYLTVAFLTSCNIIGASTGS